MSSLPRRERWRVSRTQAASGRTQEGVPLMGRKKVAVFRAGQVPPGQPWSPISWDQSEPRVAALYSYTPDNPTGAWDTHRETIFDLVLRVDSATPRSQSSPGKTRHTDIGIAYVLHLLFDWAERHGYSTNPESLLMGDRMDEFIAATFTNKSTRATYRTRLRNISATVFPSPREISYVRNPTPSPHSANERDRFFNAVQSLIAGHNAVLKTRQELYRNAMCLLALTFGAGCNSRAVHLVRQGWLKETPDGLWLHRPDRSVPIPVAARWADVLRASLTGDEDAFLIRPQGAGQRSQQVGIICHSVRVKASAFTGFDSDRASRLWHIELLEAAHFDVIAQMCNYQPSNQVPADLVPFLATRPIDESSVIARGWVK